MVEGAKLSGGEMNNWAEVAGIGVTETTVTTTERWDRLLLTG